MPHVARRMLKVGDGWLSPGQPYPDELVTPTLLSLGWVEAVHDVPAPVTVPEEDPATDDADAGDVEQPSRRRSKRRSRA